LLNCEWMHDPIDFLLFRDAAYATLFAAFKIPVQTLAVDMRYSLLDWSFIGSYS
jgi:hypothetical protein